MRIVPSSVVYTPSVISQVNDRNSLFDSGDITKLELSDIDKKPYKGIPIAEKADARTHNIIQDPDRSIVYA